MHQHLASLLRARGGRGSPAHLGDLVKLAKQFVEHKHQLFGGALAGQEREPNDVGVEDAVGGGEREIDAESSPVERENASCLCHRSGSPEANAAEKPST